jgi:hypothetical protein
MKMIVNNENTNGSSYFKTIKSDYDGLYYLYHTPTNTYITDIGCVDVFDLMLIKTKIENIDGLDWGLTNPMEIIKQSTNENITTLLKLKQWINTIIIRTIKDKTIQIQLHKQTSNYIY